MQVLQAHAGALRGADAPRRCAHLDEPRSAAELTGARGRGPALRPRGDGRASGVIMRVGAEGLRSNAIRYVRDDGREGRRRRGARVAGGRVPARVRPGARRGLRVVDGVPAKDARTALASSTRSRWTGCSCAAPTSATSSAPRSRRASTCCPSGTCSRWAIRRTAARALPPTTCSTAATTSAATASRWRWSTAGGRRLAVPLRRQADGGRRRLVRQAGSAPGQGGDERLEDVAALLAPDRQRAEVAEVGSIRWRAVAIRGGAERRRAA